MLFYYAFQEEDTPGWAKRIILGGVAYLLSPVDLIPDLTPILGYTDDISVLLIGLSTIALYVTDNVKMKARLYTKKVFQITNL